MLTKIRTIWPLVVSVILIFVRREGYDVPGWDTNVCVTHYITLAHVPVLIFGLLSRGDVWRVEFFFSRVEGQILVCEVDKSVNR